MHVNAWDSHGTVAAGEVIDLEAVYNAAQPVDDVMGIMVVHVWETPDLYGGTVPPPEVSGDVRPATATDAPRPPGGEHGHHH